eukprot:scaffold202925_cov21-Tisochrysis_lutea.AAC.1
MCSVSTLMPSFCTQQVTLLPELPISPRAATMGADTPKKHAYKKPKQKKIHPTKPNKQSIEPAVTQKDTLHMPASSTFTVSEATASSSSTSLFQMQRTSHNQGMQLRHTQQAHQPSGCNHCRQCTTLEGCNPGTHSKRTKLAGCNLSTASAPNSQDAIHSQQVHRTEGMQLRQALPLHHNYGSPFLRFRTGAFAQEHDLLPVWHSHCRHTTTTSMAASEPSYRAK